ncbi:A disintegrin and metalloproteinase with thrombospondin motifs 14-like 1, partial [Homarus americanus]
YVTSSPSYVTSSPSYTTSSPSYTTSSPSYTTSSPSYATSSPSYVTSSPNYATPSPSSFVTPSPSYVSSYPSYVTSSPSILVTSPSNYVISSRYGTASPSPSIIPASPSIVPATPSKDVLNDVEITQSLVEPKIEHVQKRKRENGPELIHGQTYIDEDEMDFVEMDQISNPGNKLINQGEEFRVANNATGNEGEESEEESDVILTLDQTSINNNHTEMTPIDPTKPMVHRISDQEPINGGEEEAVFSVGNFDLTGSDFHFSFPSQYFQDLFIPLLKRITRGGSISSQNTTKNITIPSTSPTKASTSNSNSGDDASTSIKHRKGTKPIRLAFLREAARVEPILAVTAPAHTRANLIGSCTRSCGGGTRLVTQVCVDLMSPEKQVDEELCEGLPNYKAPFNQSCNTFPCQTPGWVVGPWSLCSEWCGVGLQHRLVQCAVPLVPGTSSVTAGYYLAPSRCIGDQPKQARLCDGPCLPVDCNLEKNVLHPACYYLLQDTPLEQDHSQ